MSDRKTYFVSVVEEIWPEGVTDENGTADTPRARLRFEAADIDIPALMRYLNGERPVRRRSSRAPKAQE